MDQPIVRTSLSIAACFAALFLVGCSGSGGSTAVADPSAGSSSSAIAGKADGGIAARCTPLTKLVHATFGNEWDLSLKYSNSDGPGKDLKCLYEPPGAQKTGQVVTVAFYPDTRQDFDHQRATLGLPTSDIPNLGAAAYSYTQPQMNFIEVFRTSPPGLTVNTMNFNLPPSVALGDEIAFARKVVDLPMDFIPAVGTH